MPGLSFGGALALLVLLAGGLLSLAEARVSFEKMTNRDYAGLTYYTIQNVSLFECLGWCKEESLCQSAVFSFVVNPFAALQETTCQLQNETQARSSAYTRQIGNGEQVTVVAQPQKATNLYFFNKIDLPSEAVCSRLWAFERFPNRRLRYRDRPAFHAASKEHCQAACMNEQRFVCRSLEFSALTQQCWLSAHDRRSPLVQHLAHQQGGSSSSSHGGSSGGSSLLGADLLEAPGTDYFENACLLGEDICNDSRNYDYAKTGLPLHRTAHFVELNYYPDKEMLVKSQAGCVKACTIEHEFICRSILFRATFKAGQPNCALYHLDQRTFPDGADTFLAHGMQPLLDSGETSAIYLEAVCNDTVTPMQVAAALAQSGSGGPSPGGPNGITLPPSSITILPSSTTPGGLSVHPGPASGSPGAHAHVLVHSNHSSSASMGMSSSSSSSMAPSSPASIDPERFVSAFTSTLPPLGASGQSLGGAPTTVRLPASFGPPSSTVASLTASAGELSRPPAHITLGPPGAHAGSRPVIPPQHIMISPAPPPSRDSGAVGGLVDVSNPPTSLQLGATGGLSSHDQNCDAHGFCYDVALKCTDTKMIVNVKTQRPFHGRIYALGRSETCNANIKNQNQFQLDMYLTGQDCNTQSASGTYTNTIVLQHHNVVLTKADKVYHVRCTYETASRNVSFGMLPVKDMFEVDVNDRNQEAISITASLDAPLPKISILTLEGKEASTVRIGDRLTFRIEIPDNTPYGIFARSCIAMAKDARSTFEIIDEHGCPVDHTIFPSFLPVANGNALESNYEAFRFTESYGVIFQCNVKYCIGKCEPVPCGIGREQVDAWGRKKRSIPQAKSSGPGKPLGDDMTLSREIVVLDLKEKDPSAAAQFDDNNPMAAPNSPTAPQLHQTPSTNGGLLADQQDAGQPLARSGKQSATGAESASARHCISSQSLFVLICSIGLFFVLYVCVVAYFFARRDPKISHIKQQYH